MKPKQSASEKTGNPDPINVAVIVTNESAEPSKVFVTVIEQEPVEPMKVAVKIVEA